MRTPTRPPRPQPEPPYDLYALIGGLPGVEFHRLYHRLLQALRGPRSGKRCPVTPDELAARMRLYKTLAAGLEDALSSPETAFSRSQATKAAAAIAREQRSEAVRQGVAKRKVVRFRKR